MPSYLEVSGTVTGQAGNPVHYNPDLNQEPITGLTEFFFNFQYRLFIIRGTFN